MFYAVACVAALATLAVLLFGIEPRNLKAKQVEPGSPQRRTVLQIIGGGFMLILRNTWQVCSCFCTCSHVYVGLYLCVSSGADWH